MILKHNLRGLRPLGVVATKRTVMAAAAAARALKARDAKEGETRGREREGGAHSCSLPAARRHVLYVVDVDPEHVCMLFRSVAIHISLFLFFL